MYICMCIHIYIYIYRERERERPIYSSIEYSKLYNCSPGQPVASGSSFREPAFEKEPYNYIHVCYSMYTYIYYMYIYIYMYT